MNITEIRVKLVGGNAERLRAFCSMTLDGDFVIRDLKVIDGTNGPFVAMPSRKLTDRCPKCGGNVLINGSRRFIVRFRFGIDRGGANRPAVGFRKGFFALGPVHFVMYGFFFQ